MPLSEQEIRRLNLSMPVANDVGLGDILKALESASGGEISVTWNDVSGKPSTFAPSPHTHAIADVANLQAELNAKLETVAWGGVTGKPSTFPPATHTHTIDQVTNLQTELDSIKARLTALEGGGGV